MKKKSLPPKVYLPNSEKDIQSIIEALEEGYPIIVNVIPLSCKERYRVIDFLSGYTFALRGKREKLDECIYSFILKE